MHLIKDTPNFDVPFGLSLCDLFPAIRTETSVAQLVNARPSEFEGSQFDLRLIPSTSVSTFL